MSHDATKVLLGTVGVSGAESSIESGDPTTFTAGLAVRRSTTGDLSLTSGNLIGVSLGIPLSDTTVETVVVRSGSKVPLLLTAGFTPVFGATVQVSATTGKAVASGVSTAAIYVSSTLSGIDPLTKAEVPVALINMVGGL